MGQLSLASILDQASISVQNRSVEARSHCKALLLNWLRETALKHPDPTLEIDPAVEFTLTAGTARYTIPTGFIRNLKISIKDERGGTPRWIPLNPFNSFEEYRRKSDRDDKHFPTRYAVRLQSYYIYPTPDKAYTLSYVYEKAPSTPGDNDIPWFPDDSALIEVAASYFLAYDARLDEAAIRFKDGEAISSGIRKSHGQDLEVSGNRVELDPHYYGALMGYGNRATKDNPLGM